MKNRSEGLILSYINTFLNMICGLFLSSFLLRQLGNAEYGLYQTVASFVNYLVLLEFGTGTVMARNLSKCKAKKASQEEINQNISTIWGITNILCGMIVCVSVIFYFMFDMVYANSLTAGQIASGKNMFIFLVIVLILHFYAQTINGVTLSHERYSYSAKIAIIRNLSRTTLLVLAILFWKKAILIVIIDTIINFCIVIYGIWFCKTKFNVSVFIKGFNKAILKTSLPLCLALFLQTVVNQTNNTVGKFILGIVSGPEEVALFSVGLYIYSVFSSLTTIPISMYLPQITNDIIGGAEGKELTKKLIQPCRLIVIIGGAVLFGFIAIGKQFISIVYGEEYLMAWIVAVILMVPMFVNMSNAVVLNVLDVKNKRLVRSFILMITTLLNIGMTIVLIRKFGILGTSIATGLSTALQVVILNIYYFKFIGIKIIYLFKQVYKGIVLYQIIGSIFGYLISQMISNIYLSFICGGLVYIIVSFGGYFIFGVNPQEKEMIKNIKNKFVKS